MKNLYLHIRCENDSIIKIGEKTFETDKFTGELNLKVDDFEDMYIYVYPISKENLYMSFCVKLCEGVDSIYSNNKNCEVYKLPENHYILNMKSVRVFKENYKTENSFTAQDKTIYSYKLGKESQLSVKTKEKTEYFYLYENVEDCEIETFSGGVVFKFGKVCVIYSNGQFKKYDCLKVDVQSSVVKILSSMYDICGRGKLTTLEVRDGKLCENFDYVYLNKEPNKVKKEYAISVSFIESIKCEDLPRAREYLSEKLNNSLSDKHLKAFFGSIEKIEKVPYYNDDSCVVYVKDKKSPKVFTFELKDFKIQNIIQR